MKERYKKYIGKPLKVDMKKLKWYCDKYSWDYHVKYYVEDNDGYITPTDVIYGYEERGRLEPVDELFFRQGWITNEYLYPIKCCLPSRKEKLKRILCQEIK
jgi:hypothetical protein